MLVFRHLAPLLGALLVLCQPAAAQVLERSLGDFSLKVGTTPTRTMAQGLVSPTGGSDAFHGGLDVTHASGLYMGQWSPNMGLVPESDLELDSYLGFKKPFDQTLGYELGMIRYSYPVTSLIDSHEVYAGLRVLDSRLGAAFSDDIGVRNSTLFVDLGSLERLGMNVRMQYATHQFDTTQIASDGSLIGGFNDWSLKLSRPWLGIDMNLIYSGSSLSSDSCNVYSGHNPRCEQTFTIKAVRTLF